MKLSPSFSSPNVLAWSSASFSLAPYNLIFLPGGHEKSVRQVIDSPIVHRHLLEYFPQAVKGSAKAVAAICHGVQVLSETLDDEGRSVMRGAKTTSLPGVYENGAYCESSSCRGL